MSELWTPKEIEIIEPLLNSPGSYTQLGRDGAAMLRSEGYSRTGRSVELQIWKLRHEHEQQ